jgi:LuxR family quorum sensing-dependent transcriptional regulator
MGQSDTYSTRVFDFFEKIRDVHSPADVQRLVIAELAWFGVDYATIWELPQPGMTIEASIRLNNRPADYVEHYEREKLVLKDPVVSELRRLLAPFSWEDLRQRALSRGERTIIDEARDYGADDGFVVPILSQSGRLAIVSSCGKEPDLSSRGRAALEMVSIYSHQALQRALSQERREKGAAHIPLTPREREIMTWVAAGKSFMDIGEILNISDRTVGVHVGNAKRKLDAAQLPYAIAEAFRRGEIVL